MWTKRGKACLILIFSANTNCENMAYRSFRSEKCSARGVRKVTTGIISEYLRRPTGSNVLCLPPAPTIPPCPTNHRDVWLFQPAFAATPLSEYAKNRVGFFRLENFVFAGIALETKVFNPLVHWLFFVLWAVNAHVQENHAFEAASSHRRTSHSSM